MIDPRMLFPEALGVEWGWTVHQCTSKLGVASMESGHCDIPLKVVADDTEFEAGLVFWVPIFTDPSRLNAHRWTLQSVQLSLPLPQGVDPGEYIEEAMKEEPQTEEEWNIIKTEFERRQAGVRDYFRTVQQQYLQFLGPTPYQAEEADLRDYAPQTKALTCWKFPDADVELSVLAENCSGWEFEEVRLEISTPTSLGSFFG
jgi:hypothetical protein